jgi:hypothetical protein
MFRNTDRIPGIFHVLELCTGTEQILIQMKTFEGTIVGFRCCLLFLSSEKMCMYLVQMVVTLFHITNFVLILIY